MMLTGYRNQPVTLQDWYNRFFDDQDTPHFYGNVAYPATNIRTTENGAVLEVDLPGVAKDDIEITMEKGNTLRLSVERKEEKETDPEEKEEVVLKERRFGKYERSFRLPFQIKEDSAQADYKNGVLTITLEKSDAEMPRRIQIKAD